MIHTDDIEQSLAENDIRGIETAFRALVDFPHEEEIEGAETIEVLCSLLDRVSHALTQDQSTMPATTCRAIDAAMGDPIMSDASYAEGATIALRHHDHWRALYVKHAMGSESA